MNDIVNPNQQYRIISLNHTHKRDKWITLWGANNAGYHYSKEMSGMYDGYRSGYHDSEGNLPITEEFANTLFEWLDYYGTFKWLIPNNVQNRKILGVHYVKGELTKKKS